MSRWLSTRKISNAIKFSIIICTYNRSRYLSDLVESLRKQRYLQEKYEIVLVDNGSSDNTHEEVVRINESDKKPVRYLCEPNLGASIARNAGAAIARGSILAFIDDDAFADSMWLEMLHDAFIRYPNVACIGGRIKLIWQVARPSWFPVNAECYLGSTQHFGAGECLMRNQAPLESNMAIRREAFFEIGGFDPGTGPRGSNFYTNEGLDLSNRLRAQGHLILYVPSAVVYHRVPAERVRRRYILERCYRQGLSDVRIEQHTQPTRRGDLLRSALITFFQIFENLANSVFLVMRGDQINAFRELLWGSGRLGRSYQLLLLALGSSNTN